jgi:ribosomal protein L25 (general stress protein Ctc)
VRKQGRVPAVLYGKKGEVVTLWVAGADARKILHDGLQELTLETGGKPEAVRVGEIQFDAIGETMLHLDFLRA